MSVDHFCPHAPFMQEVRWPIPEFIAPGYYVEMRIGVSVTNVYAAMQSTKTELLVRIKGVNESGVPTLIGYAHYFDDADGLTPWEWKKAKYVLSGTRMVGKEGGTLTYWFNSLSLSTGPTLLVNEYHLKDHWGAHVEGVIVS
jgi:hypothetical protein